MATPWVDRVRTTGQLTVYRGPALCGGDWLVVFDDAFRAFNDLSREHALGVTLVLTETPPSATGAGGADVAVEVGDGEVAATYEGTIAGGAFNGNAMHGRTNTFNIDGAIHKAFVFLPREPMGNTPRGRRAVGAPVRKVIAVHELVHACGLDDNNDHSRDDLFNGFPASGRAPRQRTTG